MALSKSQIDKARVTESWISRCSPYSAGDGKLVEVQLRTALQHLWAELSERTSDKLGASIKYGRGDVEAREELWESSEVIQAHDRIYLGEGEQSDFSH